MKIFILFGTTGEYSDRSEWVVRAYRDEEQTKLLVAEYSAKAKELFVRSRLPVDDPNYLRLPAMWKGEKWDHPDPTFTMAYTGTEYFYTETELSE